MFGSTNIKGVSKLAAVQQSKFDRVCAILDKYDKNPNKLIPILQDIQEEYTYLP